MRRGAFRWGALRRRAAGRRRQPAPSPLERRRTHERVRAHLTIARAHARARARAEMDYGEEQEMELEALESIFAEDLRVVSPEGDEGVGQATSGKCFAFELSPKESEDDPEPTVVPVRVLLSLAHDGDYPDAAPVMKLRALRGAATEDVDALRGRLEQEIEDNLVRGAAPAPMRSRCAPPARRLRR